MINIYLACGSVKGTHMTPQKNSGPTPAIVRGMAAVLVVRCYDAEKVEISDLSAYAAWSLIVKESYGQNLPVLLATNDVVESDGTLTVTLTETNTAELAAAIAGVGSREVQAQLSGYRPGAVQPEFVVQFPLIVNNTLDDSGGPPEEIKPNFYTRAQTDALLAAVDAAQVATVTRYNSEFSELEFSDELGYYKALTAPGEALRLVYNATECVSLALRVRSANPEISGTVAVAIKANGVPVQNAALPVGAAAAWHEVMFDGYVTGALSIELTKELTDGGAPVSVIVDGLRLACKLVSDAAGHTERQVAAGPLCYSDASGYTLRLDEDYGINIRQPVSGLLAVALRLQSANPEISGDVAVNVLVNGVAVKTCSIPVSVSAAWQPVLLDAPVSGAVMITRDTANAADTLKDGGAVVSAVVGDLNYLYQEQV